MKLLSFLSLIAMVIPVAPPARALADKSPVYAYACTRESYFCSEPDERKALFAVPYTYCVRILSDEGEWYMVSYAENSDIYIELTGYCLKSGLRQVASPPENLYLNLPVTITFEATPPAGSLPTIGQIDVVAAYYGNYTFGAEKYSYVLYNGSFGYILGSTENYPVNELPPEKTEPPPTDDSPAILSAIIIIVAAAAITVLFISGRARYGGKRQ